MDFIAIFAHLQVAERSAFLAFSQANFLHIKLGRVDNPARGRHNRVSYISAELASTDRLPNRDVIRSRLFKRFPAIVLGYSIINPVDISAPLKVTTFTHQFDWPSNSDTGPGIPKLTELLRVSEWIHWTEAEQAGQSRPAA